jgi:hypothetical protein
MAEEVCEIEKLDWDATLIWPMLARLASHGPDGRVGVTGSGVSACRLNHRQSEQNLNSTTHALVYEYD